MKVFRAECCLISFVKASCSRMSWCVTKARVMGAVIFSATVVGYLYLVLLWLLAVKWDCYPVFTSIRKELRITRPSSQSLMTLMLLWVFDGSVQFFHCSMGDMKLYWVCKILELEKVWRLIDFQIGFHSRSWCTIVLQSEKTRILEKRGKLLCQWWNVQEANWGLLSIEWKRSLCFFNEFCFWLLQDLSDAILEAAAVFNFHLQVDCNVFWLFREDVVILGGVVGNSS